MGDVIQIRQESEAEPALRAVVYLRVSTLDQANTDYSDDGYSLAAQGDACRRSAERLGAEVVDEYVDRGKSARSADRPQLQAMLRRIRDERDIDLVIVHKIDRLARNRADDVQIVLAIKQAGAALISATENIDETPSGKLLHGIMASVAEFYSGNLGLEATKGMKKKAELGGMPGKAPVGYLNRREDIEGKNIAIVVPDPERADHVRWLFRAFAKGEHSIEGMCAALADRGFSLRATARFPARPIHKSALQHMLTNRFYVGVVTFQGIEYPGRHEPLVDPVTFERVQALLHSRRRGGDKPEKHDHAIKALVHCARCGSRMGVMHPRSRSGSRYAYVFCLGRQKNIASCTQGLLRLETVENAIVRHLESMRVDDLRAVLAREAVREWHLATSDDSERELRSQRLRLDQLKRRRQKAKDAYFADAIGIEELKAEQQQIGRKMLEAEAIIERHSANLQQLAIGTESVLRLLANPAKAYLAAPESIRRMLLQELFEAIWIRDQDLVGVDVTQPYAELLGVAASKAAALEGTGEGHITVTRVQDRSEREYLRVERPRGLLAVDLELSKRAALVRGSNVTSLVGVDGLEPSAKGL